MPRLYRAGRSSDSNRRLKPLAGNLPLVYHRRLHAPVDRNGLRAGRPGPDGAQQRFPDGYVRADRDATD